MAKTAEVFTNDPQRPQFTLMISMIITTEEVPQGTRVGPFIVGPTNHWSAHVPHGLQVNGVLTLFNTGEQPVLITNIAPGGEAFNVTLQPLEQGKRYAVNIISSNQLPNGNHRQTVKLTTDSKETPEIALELEANVVPPVRANPARILFEDLPVSRPDYDITTLSKFLWVSVVRSAGLELRVISCTLPFIKVKIEAADSDYTLRIGFTEKPQPGTHTGLIKIETNNKDVPVVEVPITVIAK